MAVSTGRNTLRATPGRGEIVPLLRGQSPSGAAISTGDYYMRRNLAIVFASDDERGREWIDAAACVAEAAAEQVGQVVVVAAGEVKVSGLPTMLDAGGEMRARFGLEAIDLPALFITDRYGVLFVATDGHESLPDLRPSDIPRWLEFIACRCS